MSAAIPSSSSSLSACTSQATRALELPASDVASGSVVKSSQCGTPQRQQSAMPSSQVKANSYCELCHL